MNRISIQNEARRRMAIVEDRYADFHPIPLEIQAYYRLCHLIAGGHLETYYNQFGGWLPIQIGDAVDGKYDLGFGALTQFERDCAEHLNADIGRREFTAARSAPQGYLENGRY